MNLKTRGRTPAVRSTTIQLVVVLDERTQLRHLLPGHAEQVADDVSVRAGVTDDEDGALAVFGRESPSPPRGHVRHLIA